MHGLDIFLKFQHWAKTTPSDDFWFTAILYLVVAISCFFFAFKFFRDKRLITDTPTSNIRSAAQGYVELVGRGQLLEGDRITSPTGTDCIWYHLEIEMHYRNNSWVTVKQETSSDLFLLKDSTGECVIDADGAEVRVVDEAVWFSNNDRSLRRPKSKQSKLPRWLRGYFSVGMYRYTERLLHKGETLYAIGLFKTVGGAGATSNVKEDVRDLLREWKQDTEALLKKFDENKDGEIDLKEWEKIREAAYQEVLKKQDHQQTLPPVNLMSKTQDKRRPYLLSALDQSALTKRLHYYAVSCFIGFLVFVMSFVCFMSWRFGG